MNTPNIELSEEYISYIYGAKILAKHYDTEAQKLRAIIYKDNHYEALTFALGIGEVTYSLKARTHWIYNVRQLLSGKPKWNRLVHEMAQEGELEKQM